MNGGERGTVPPAVMRPAVTAVDHNETMMSADQGSLFADAPREHTYGVGELAAGITRVVASAFPAEVWIRGEINGLRPVNANGHAYFSLCERNSRRGPTATVGVALYRKDRLRVERELREWPGFQLADGVEVRIRGRVQYGYGRIQVVMSAVDPVHTLGRLAAARDRVLGVLAADGLLETNGRLPLPAIPLRVGLVTSADSAACHDVLAELEASGFGFSVALADARVQGTGAEASLLAALAALARRRPDVVLVVRGGGARTDLAAFDSERVARAIAAMPVPVVTGIGHEIDTSVADEVAHTACKTPTACAGVLVEQVANALDRAEKAWAGIARGGGVRLATAEATLDRRAGSMAVLAGGSLTATAGRLDARVGRVVTLARSRLGSCGGRIDAAAHRLDPVRLYGRLDRAEVALGLTGERVRRAATRATASSAALVDTLAARVEGADPARALARGWSLTRTVDGRLVRRAADLSPGQEIVTTLAAGQTRSTVTEIDTDQPGEPQS